MNVTRRHRALPALLAILIAMLVVAGCGNGDSDATGDDSGAGATTSAQPEPIAVGDCSTAGEQIELPEQEDLPRQVQQTREQLFAAAMHCNFEELGMLAEGTKGFSFSFGADGDPVEYWRAADEQEQVLAQLARILGTPHVSAPGEAGGYAWPSAHRENPTARDWTLLEQAGIATGEQVEQYRRAGSYLGYRTGIAEDGRWLFFIAGD